MKDSIINQTGNSRFLRSAISAAATWEQARAMLIAGTLPVDLAGVNTDGFLQLGNNLGKASLLKDQTAALFGLDDLAVPDDVLAFLGKYNTHWWSVLHGEAYTEYQEKRTANDTLFQMNGYTRHTLQYSTSVSVDPSTGEVSMVDPQDYVLNGATGDRDSFSAQLASLVAMAPIYLSGMFDDNEAIYYLPVGSTYGYGTSGANSTIRYSWVDEVLVARLNDDATIPSFKVSSQLVYIEAGETTYVNSTDRDAYPDGETVDSLTYTYLGIPLQNAVTAPKVFTGGYVGAGVHGADNANVLPLPARCVLLFVIDAADGDDVGWLSPLAGIGTHGNIVTSTATEVSWYFDSSTTTETLSNGRQFNTAGHVYHYLAFCQ